MITTCTVIVDNNKDCLQYMLQSIKKYSSIIDEILICDVNIKGDAASQDSIIDGIPIHQFKLDDACLAYAHAFGLHACIDRSKNDYLMFIDHDVIFQRRCFDQWFLDTYIESDLDFLGVEHTYCVQKQCFGDFPTVIAAIIHRDKLPPKEFLSGCLKYRPFIEANKYEHDDYEVAADGLYLMQSPIPSIYKEFPNPNGNFDVGCNLWYFYRYKKWMSIKQSTHMNYVVDDKPLLFHCGKNDNRMNILKNIFDQLP